MVDITATMVKQLRERTGTGIMECKQALIQSQGNIDLAITNMRKAGKAKADKKACRIAAEGIIITKISNDAKYGVIIELNCETDFVAQDKAFNAFGNELINAALEERIPNITILQTKFEKKRTALVANIGENITIRRMGVLEGYILGSYLHRDRIGVIVSMVSTTINQSQSNNELVKHIAMHIAANEPEYLKNEDIPSIVIDNEYQIQMDIAMQSGKSYEIAKKIVEGRMRKFTSNISLISQPFVMDASKTIGQLLDENHAQVKNFIRFKVGDGLNI